MNNKKKKKVKGNSKPNQQQPAENLQDLYLQSLDTNPSAENLKDLYLQSLSTNPSAIGSTGGSDPSPQEHDHSIGHELSDAILSRMKGKVAVTLGDSIICTTVGVNLDKTSDSILETLIDHTSAALSTKSKKAHFLNTLNLLDNDTVPFLSKIELPKLAPGDPDCNIIYQDAADFNFNVEYSSVRNGSKIDKPSTDTSANTNTNKD